MSSGQFHLPQERTPMLAAKPESDTAGETSTLPQFNRGLRFWLAMICIMLSLFLAALDAVNLSAILFKLVCLTL